LALPKRLKIKSQPSFWVSGFSASSVFDASLDSGGMEWEAMGALLYVLEIAGAAGELEEGGGCCVAWAPFLLEREGSVVYKGGHECK